MSGIRDPFGFGRWEPTPQELIAHWRDVATRTAAERDRLERLFLVHAEKAERDREALRAEKAELVAVLKRATSPEIEDEVERLINERHGGDCSVIEATAIAFEIAGSRAAIAKAAATEGGE
jgi:glycine/D-amino acid oxidase-like deaminating enzyme